MRLSIHPLTLLYLCGAWAAPQLQLNGTIIIGQAIESAAFSPQEFFAGIPFAEPPIDALRFAPPVLKTKLDVPVFNATAYGPSCAQITVGSSVGNMSEDCLTINILRPANLPKGTALPVMTWIFGGGFSIGSAELYNGTALVSRSIARNTPVIYVTFNYRLGPFGFPQGNEAVARGSLNLGLKDQLAALEWIQQNIASFGGDPRKVMLFGQSAGAISISFLYLNSGLERYARAAIFESGSQNTFPTFEPSDRMLEWELFTNSTPECAGARQNGSFACLREASTNTLLQSWIEVAITLEEETPFYPVIDGPGGVIPDLPSRLLAAGRFSRIPFIAGTNLDEGTTSVQQNTSSDADIIDFMYTNFMPRNVDTPPASLTAAANNLLVLYPDIPALGSPYNTGNETFGLSPEYKRLSSIAGDVFFQALRRTWIQTASGVGVKAFAYLFADPAAVTNASLGITHSDEIPYVYGETASANSSSPAGILSTEMMDYWISFAVSLDPNDGRGSNRPKWQQYTHQKEVVLQLIGGNTTLIPDTYRSSQIAYINSIAECHFRFLPTVAYSRSSVDIFISSILSLYSMDFPGLIPVVQACELEVVAINGSRLFWPYERAYTKDIQNHRIQVNMSRRWRVGGPLSDRSSSLDQRCEEVVSKCDHSEPHDSP
ncbi:Lipase 2 [Grifola frondosa]|uniref:Carboxylic ester hydrolase n=1 Tax=Grifola frondosa TaxID=5627 RepID=A0A1C7MHE2_GRIFR|nr:Lipase 2 [Grifola frondosa]